MKADIYTRQQPRCNFCRLAKELLEEKGIEYSEFPIDKYPINREQVYSRVKAAIGVEPRSVPQIFIDDEYIGGYEALKNHLRK